jgi:adenosyl cobinamide kinase/adenosyl cobinamide phosphate guanylyltransferase
MPLTLLTGGARSGKSTIAVEAAKATGHPVTFVATAEPLDDDMAERIRHHRHSRPQGWTLIEEPLDLAAALDRTRSHDTVVVDCLTLWVSNLVGSGVPAIDVEAAASHAAAIAAARAGATLIVTNEVGSGIVPVDAEVRRWRDLLGRVNSVFSASASDAYLVAAGRVLALSLARDLLA